MPTILLIRHGQASFGTTNYDVLSQRGVYQTEMLRLALQARGVRPDRVVTGGLQRQIDTAELARLPGWPDPTVDPRWNEYEADDVIASHSASPARLQADREEAPALTSREFQYVLDGALLQWIAHAERSACRTTWPAFSGGGVAALAELAASLRRGQTGVVFTSAGTISAVCVGVLGLPAESFVPFNRVQVNTGITKIAHGERGASMVSFNEHAHLEHSGDGSLVTFR
jgi:broad specificity phosphatase PhoE